eukprot:g29091.t1
MRLAAWLCGCSMSQQQQQSLQPPQQQQLQQPVILGMKHLGGGSFQGKLSQGLADGHGVWIHADGTRYAGQWEKDQGAGLGVLTVPQGAVYCGEFAQGLRNGNGVLQWEDGENYQGEWSWNGHQGHGVYKYQNGSQYEGDFADSFKHGVGVGKFLDGSTHRGEYKKGVCEGHGVFVWPNGQEYHGAFSPKWRTWGYRGGCSSEYTDLLPSPYNPSPSGWDFTSRVSLAFKAPVLVTMCMGVEDRSPIGMLILVGKRYGGKSLLDMIIRWQKYIVATPKGDWLDENRLTELQIQRDYGDQPSPIQAILDDEDEDHQPHFNETTHEHTTIQPLEKAMRPDSPTHEQGLQEEQKSDQ